MLITSGDYKKVVFGIFRIILTQLLRIKKILPSEAMIKYRVFLKKVFYKREKNARKNRDDPAER